MSEGASGGSASSTGLRTLIRGARIGDRPVDVRIVRGIIAEVGDLRREPADHLVPAHGGEVIAGLHDHHVHVLAAAARRGSVSVRGLENDLDAVLATIRAAAARVDRGEWIRVVDYREEPSAGGRVKVPMLDRVVLDRVAPANPVRVQDATGGLWVLNSQALAHVPADLVTAGASGDAEVDDDGFSNGRFHRMDAELAAAWPASVADLRPVGEGLLRVGVTGLTDATPTTDPVRTRALTDAHLSGALPQDLHLLGDRKIVLSDHALPDVDQLCARITAVHASGRPVAIHTVTLESGFLACHALAIAGTLPGDRLEHAAVATRELVRMIADLGLTVITQPGFISDRGEMYRRALVPADHGGVYRYRSFLEAGVRVAPSSDHPFGPLDPWTAISAAVDRRTEIGAPFAQHEAVEPDVVLRGYQSPLRAPGASRFQGGVTVGVPADLCVLRAPLPEVFAQLREVAAASADAPAESTWSPVVATLIGADVWQFDE